MGANLFAYGDVHVDGAEAVRGELHVEHEVEVVTSRTSRPSAAWCLVDAAGHWHAAADDRTFPTLRESREHVPCDGACGSDGCEGYDRTVWECRICGEDVRPEFIDGIEDTAIQGPVNWRVHAYTYVPMGTECTVRFISDHGLALGVGVVAEINASSERTVSTIWGNGPIGHRKSGNHKKRERSQSAPRAIEGS